MIPKRIVAEITRNWDGEEVDQKSLNRPPLMPCGSWDKRFRREVLCNAEVSGKISDKAAAQLWRLVIRYRRQIVHPEKSVMMKIAEEKAAPDFRKQNAAANEQAKIDEMKRKYGNCRA